MGFMSDIANPGTPIHLLLLPNGLRNYNGNDAVENTEFCAVNVKCDAMSCYQNVTCNHSHPFPPCTSYDPFISIALKAFPLITFFKI